MAQLMPLPLTVSCFSKIQIGFTFLVPVHPGGPGQRAVCVCACVRACVCHSSVAEFNRVTSLRVMIFSASGRVIGHRSRQRKVFYKSLSFSEYLLRSRDISALY